jgi:acyl carrier protein
MVKEYILELLQKNYTIDDTEDIDNLNYIEAGYVSSLGLIQFIVDLEDKYGISFTDDEISSEDFQVVGKLTKLIESKIKMYSGE